MARLSTDNTEKAIGRLHGKGCISVPFSCVYLQYMKMCIILVHMINREHFCTHGTLLNYEFVYMCSMPARHRVVVNANRGHTRY